jgi:hypothetical protein
MAVTAAEQLRTFHITGHGLTGQMPDLSPAAIAGGRALPSEQAAYPICLAADFSVHPDARQWQIPFAAEAAVLLPIAALLRAHQSAQAEFRERLLQAADRLEDLLVLDESHAESALSPAAVSAVLGGRAGTYLDVSALAAALRRRPSPVHRMAPERRQRCQEALTTLREALAKAAAQPRFVLFHSGPVPANPFGGLLLSSPDPCSAALAYAERELTAFEAVLRAIRVAHLELEDAFEPGLHEAILERFRWQAASAAELAALPPIVAVLPADRPGEYPLGPLFHLLRSGCPIQVLAPKPSLSEDDLQGNIPDLAALAVTSRDAFVLQGSLAYPEHLMSGLAAMSRSRRPALAVIATPSGGGWPEAAVLPLARAWPLLTFDPAAASDWRGCFAIQPIEPNTWTPAHAAAMNPSLQNHFRLLPEMPGEHDPVELGQYLAQFHERPPMAVPYFATSSEGGPEARVAISRDLATYCHKRQQAWSLLEQWTMAQRTAAPQASSEALSTEARAAAVREGASLAIAQVIALLTGAKPA